MIGQKEVLKQIDNLIEKGFPRFIVITGQRGQGKTELAKYIKDKLSYPLIEFGIKIDEIREMIEMAYKQTEPIIYLIQNADNMSLNAKNSLLKLVEEPPQQAYIIMELQQIENTLDTIKSRCQQIKMEDYSEQDIMDMISNISFNGISKEELILIGKIAQNKYQIDLLLKYGVNEFYNYVDKVYNNIYKVQSANSFKIAEKLDLKDDGNGYNLVLFFNCYCQKAFDDMMDCVLYGTPEKSDIIFKCITITTAYKNFLNVNGINRQMLIDNWILAIRKEWLK